MKIINVKSHTEIPKGVVMRGYTGVSADEAHDMYVKRYGRPPTLAYVIESAIGKNYVGQTIYIRVDSETPSAEAGERE